LVIVLLSGIGRANSSLFSLPFVADEVMIAGAEAFLGLLNPPVPLHAMIGLDVEAGDSGRLGAGGQLCAVPRGEEGWENVEPIGDPFPGIFTERLDVEPGEGGLLATTNSLPCKGGAERN
jgi:hypothetical protein